MAFDLPIDSVERSGNYCAFRSPITRLKCLEATATPRLVWHGSWSSRVPSRSWYMVTQAIRPRRAYLAVINSWELSCLSAGPDCGQLHESALATRACRTSFRGRLNLRYLVHLTTILRATQGSMERSRGLHDGRINVGSEMGARSGTKGREVRTEKTKRGSTLAYHVLGAPANESHTRGTSR